MACIIFDFSGSGAGIWLPDFLWFAAGAAGGFAAALAGLPMEQQLAVFVAYHSLRLFLFVLWHLFWADRKGQVDIIKLQLDLSKEYGIVLEGGGAKALIR